MENSTGWNKIQKLINQVIQNHNLNMVSSDPVIGFGLATQIYFALKECGYLKEDGKEKV